MKNHIILCIFLFTNIAFASPPQFEKGSVLVKYKKKSISKNQQIAGVLNTYKTIQGLQLVQLAKGVTVDEAIKELKNNPDVAYAEPNYILHTSEVTPNDPNFSKLWGLYNPTNGIDMNIPAAWDLTTGDENVVVAIIDTGLDYNHPDLAKNTYSHGTNAITSVDDAMDDEGHGTHVAGSITAQGNNGIGVAGVTWKTKILPCKFLDAAGSGSLADAIKCLDYVATVAKSGVKIVASNNSWGGGGFSQAMYDAIKVHQDLGILFIAAAGNEGADNDTADSFPANYALDNVISVAAFDHEGNFPEWTCKGEHSVHVAAPGVDIMSTIKGGGYESMSGTSMAAPHVTGLAALLKAYDPTLTPGKIKNLIMAGGVPSDATKTTTISGRRVRAWDKDGMGSLTCKNQIVGRLMQPTSNNVTLYTKDTLALSYLYINCAVPASADALNVTTDDGTVLTLTDSTGNGIYSGNFVAGATGQHALKFPDGSVVTVNVVKDGEKYNVSAPTADYITTTGTPLTFHDESTDTFTSPFPIALGGDTFAYNSVTVSSNGVISLTDTTFGGYNNTTLPVATAHTLVAPLWMDLNPANAVKNGAAPSLTWAVVGTAPSRKLVIEWANTPAYSGKPSKANAATFQAVFYEGSSDVRFNYKKVTFGNKRLDNGGGATIGIQVSAKTATQYSYKQSSISDDTSLLFTLAGHTPNGNNN